MNDLTKRLRDTASKGVSVWGDLQMEAAAEIERLRDEMKQMECEDLTVRIQQVENLAAENDSLRAEVERLTKQNATITTAYEAEVKDCERYADDVERLKQKPIITPCGFTDVVNKGSGKYVCSKCGKVMSTGWLQDVLAAKLSLPKENLK